MENHVPTFVVFIFHEYIIGPETVDWSWGDWSEWSKCTVSCGIDGTQTRYRSCIPPTKGGYPCPTQMDRDTQPCNIDRCSGRLPMYTSKNEYQFISIYVNLIIIPIFSLVQ